MKYWKSSKRSALYSLLLVISTEANTNTHISSEQALEKMKRIEMIYRASYTAQEYELVRKKPSTLASLGKPSVTKQSPSIPCKQPIQKRDKGDYRQFKQALAHRESSGNPRAVNKYGMMGLYQFSSTTLKDLGVTVDAQRFKRNPSLFPIAKQEQVMDRWIKRLYKELQEYCTKYNGRKIAGIHLDVSSILAGAHLVGPTGMKRWLDSKGKVTLEDGNGTSVTEYLSLFSGYSINSHIH